jgi:hypothetical protein
MFGESSPFLEVVLRRGRRGHATGRNVTFAGRDALLQRRRSDMRLGRLLL